MNKFLFIITLGLFGIMVLATPAFAVTTVSFTPLNINIEQGKRFTLIVKIDPQSVKNYTAKIQIQYLVELLEVKLFTFNDGWMALSQPGYDLVDNTNGSLIKTGGYPGGFSNPLTFGTISFLAKKSGYGVIKIGNDSIVLDGNSRNLYKDSGTQSYVRITTTTPKPIVQPVVPLTIEPIIASTTPIAELFDIVLTIENALLDKSSDLTAKTQFTSFGTVPTLVNMVYRIEDVSGKEVFIEKDEAMVETEQLVTKEFKNLDIGNGKYTLVLATTYGNNVQDKFRQAFEVGGTPVLKGEWTMAILIISILIIVGIGGFIIYRFIKRKKKINKLT